MPTMTLSPINRFRWRRLIEDGAATVVAAGGATTSPFNAGAGTISPQRGQMTRRRGSSPSGTTALQNGQVVVMLISPLLAARSGRATVQSRERSAGNDPRSGWSWQNPELMTGF